MTNSTPTDGNANAATAANAIPGKCAAIWQSILTLFAPASSEQEPDIELPDSALFNVRLSFSRHDVVFTCTRESFLLLRSYLDDPGRRSFFFNSFWINKEILCNAFIEAYVADSQMLRPNLNVITERTRTLDKTPSSQQASSPGGHLPATPDDRLDPLACNNNLDQGRG